MVDRKLLAKKIDRNILAHQYLALDKQIVYEVFQTKLSDIEGFLLMLDQNFS